MANVKFYKFRTTRGTTIRKLFKWDELNVQLADVSCVYRQEITSNGVTCAARFSCSITEDGLEVYLSSAECQRLFYGNRFDIALQLNNGDVVGVLYGYVEVR